MKILDYIKDNTLLIIPNNIKIKILRTFNDSDRLLNVKIMCLEEVRKHYFFDYDESSILYIMDKYGFNSNISKVLLKNIYYVKDIEYDSLRLSDLSNLKKELKDNDLLIYDKYFLNLIENKNIIVFGYNNISKFDKKMLDELNAKIINFDKPKEKELFVYECITLEDEVNFVFNKICSLINEGIDISKIKLANVDDKYLYTIKRLSTLYKLNINIKDDIYSSNIVKFFFNELKQTNSIDISINNIKEKFDLSIDNNNIYNSILNVCNKYVGLDYNFNNIYDCIKEDIKNIKIFNKEYKSKIEIIDFNDASNDDYIFLLGFNQGSIPKFYKDEDYISDYYKKNLLLENTEEKNNIEKQIVIDKLYSINNLFITYKLKNIDQDFYPSNLVNELSMQVNEGKVDYSITYSKIYSQVILTKYLDDLIKYGINNKNISLLYNNFNINYLSYSNKFSGIDSKRIINKLLPKLILSYTHIDNYYHCAFKYYLTNILKLDKYEETFSTVTGNLFHYILSKIYDNNFNFDEEYDNYLKEIILNESETFFIKRLKVELKIVVDYINELNKETGLTNTLLEHKIFVNKDGMIPTTFMGVVDKIMYNKNIVSIIDYKTGSSTINIYNTIYGLNMQLAIYLYLVKNTNLFQNCEFAGFYLQKILSPEVSFSLEKTYIEQKYSNLKLEGYSNSDVSILEKFIPDYENSRFVRGMKTSSKGFYPYTKIIDTETINNLVKYVDKKIEEARDNILNGNFFINPKSIDNDKIGCQFCKYKDICYVTESDFVKLNENKNLDFLGGDSNA